MDRRGDNRVDPQTSLTMLRREPLPIAGQTHEKLISIGFVLFFTINYRMNYKFMFGLLTDIIDSEN